MVKILVIEDEEHIRNEVMDWLLFEGYEVVGASNGRIGLEMALEERPNLIISDIAMPEMDGYEVLLEVRSNPKLGTIPFIFVTASAERASMRRGMDMGADDYITKPFTHMELMTAVKSRLKKVTAQQDEMKRQLDNLNDSLELERRQRLVKSRLVAMFSHDFRNPLAVILSSANLILDYEDRLSPERKRAKLNRITSSVRQLIQMLDDMLMVAELDSDQFVYNPESIDISTLLEDIVEEFQIIHDETHQLDYQSNVYQSLHIDPKIFRQIVANLVSNAIKYSPSGSTVRVTLNDVANGIELRVIDQGMGIPQKDIPQLFEPFHRANNAKDVKGTGLGLAIVKQGLELCGGSITVESNLDEGSVFIVCFPQ